MAETFRERMVRGYAYAICIDGTRSFSGTSTTYHQEIKQYAAANFTDEQIQNALNEEYITQQEYGEITAYKQPPIETTTDPVS